MRASLTEELIERAPEAVHKNLNTRGLEYCDEIHWIV